MYFGVFLNYNVINWVSGCDNIRYKWIFFDRKVGKLRIYCIEIGCEVWYE